MGVWEYGSMIFNKINKYLICTSADLSKETGASSTFLFFFNIEKLAF